MITCWGVAGVAGVMAMVLLYWMAGFDALQAIFTGGLIGTVLGLLLIFTVCSSQTSAQDLASEDKPATRYAAQSAEEEAENATSHATAHAVAPATADDALPAGVVAGTAGTEAGTAGVKPGSAGETTGVSANATSKATTVGGPEAGTIAADAVDTTAPEGNWSGVHSTPSGVMSTPAAEAKAVKAGKAPKVAKAPRADKASKAPKAAVALESDTKPAVLLTSARAEGADDLKLISGVGPKLEQTLNDLGVYHFDQVAKFKKKDIAWVDARLRFKGRIERDDWMSQAKVLAKGGETAFSKGKNKS
ncbi:ATP synthase subunit E [Sulfitobacter guttiformis KCTC 32187]|nr:ATP synthase subunit E [Sulfitobacter guttiformis KCTC 32187]